jgi:hypothetical protein
VADSSVAITAGSGTPIRVLTALGAASADQQVVTLADSAGNLLGTTAAPLPVTGPALTKGTQGANGHTVQDLKDAGRGAVILSATAVASVTTAALFTLNIWQAGAVTSATSFTVPAGKTFRVQSIQFGARFATPSTTVTFASARFDVRAISTGALAVTSALVYGDSKMAASNAPTPNSDLAIPDGLEFPAGYVIGVSHVDSAATLLLDLLIVGFTY